MDSTFLAIKLITAIYAGPLLIAAGYDLLSYRIPNLITGLTAVLYLLCALLWGVHVDWPSHVAAAGIVLACGALLFAYGIVGAGDVKLLAAISLWLGLGELPTFLALAAVFGGVFTIALLLIRQCVSMLALPRPAPAVLQPNGAIPYGVAIAAAAIWIAPQIAFLL